jgi:hypothetical protein
LRVSSYWKEHRDAEFSTVSLALHAIASSTPPFVRQSSDLVTIRSRRINSYICGIRPLCSQRHLQSKFCVPRRSLVPRTSLVARRDAVSWCGSRESVWRAGARALPSATSGFSGCPQSSGRTPSPVLPASKSGATVEESFASACEHCDLGKEARFCYVRPLRGRRKFGSEASKRSSPGTVRLFGIDQAAGCSTFLSRV